MAIKSAETMLQPLQEKKGKIYTGFNLSKYKNYIYKIICSIDYIIIQ